MAFIRASGLALLLAGASAEDAGLVKLRQTCNSLLADVSATPYSNQELSMLCRSRVPGEICRDSLHILGEKPWGPQRISVACERWERDFDMRTLEMAPERRAMSLEDLQGTMDKIMQSKNAVGVCQGESIDQCASRKKDEYPKYTQQMTDTLTQKSAKLKESYDSWMGEGSGAAKDAMEKVTSATKDMGSSVTDAATDATSAATKATDEVSSATSDAADSVTKKLGGKVELQEEAVVPPASTSSRLAAVGAGLIAASLAMVGAFAVVDRIRSVRQRYHVQEQDMLERAGQ